MSGSRDQEPRRPRYEDRTVEVPLRPRKGAEPPRVRPNVPPDRPFEQRAGASEEPWWRNVNRQVPAPPRSRVQRPSPAAQPPPAPRPGGTPYQPDRRAEPRRVSPGQRRGQQPDRHNAPVRNRQAQPGSVRRRGSQLPVLVAVGAIAILAGAVGLMVGLSRLDVLKGQVLDVSKAEAGVQQILIDSIDGYIATNVTDVAETNVVLAGITSERLTFWASLAPALDTVIV